MISNYKCPGCGKKLIAYFRTIFDCNNPECVLYQAILDEKQWLWLMENVKPPNKKEIPNASKNPTKARSKN